MLALCGTLMSLRTLISWRKSNDELHNGSPPTTTLPRANVTDILRTLELDPFVERRRMSRLVFLYKILNDHVAVPVSQMDIVQSHRPMRGSSTKQRLVVPHTRTSELKDSFTPKTLAQWNSLSLTVPHREIPYCALGIAWHQPPAHYNCKVPTLHCCDIRMAIAIIIQIQMSVFRMRQWYFALEAMV